MADEPENHTIRLLQEMRAEMKERFDKSDAAIAELQGAVTELQVAVAATRADLGIVKDDVGALKESAHIIEHDISGIKMRVERIERHTGLVKA